MGIIVLVFNGETLLKSKKVPINWSGLTRHVYLHVLGAPQITELIPVPLSQTCVIASGWKIEVPVLQFHFGLFDLTLFFSPFSV